MASRAKNVTTEVQAVGKEKYLNDIFCVIRKMENMVVVDKTTRFNSTEIRLIWEILAAKYAGKRLISTELAKLLGVTRSAISQIVNRLENGGVLKRVADDVDRKIAYVEITDEILNAYKKDLELYVDFVGRVVEKFGVEKFEQMCSLFNSVYDVVYEERAEYNQKRKYQRKES